jgi:hypothetical protein
VASGTSATGTDDSTSTADRNSPKARAVVGRSVLSNICSTLPFTPDIERRPQTCSRCAPLVVDGV